MNRYKTKRSILLLIDMMAIVVSFLLSFAIRNRALYENFGNTYGMPIYATFLAYALLIYVIICLIKSKTSVENISAREVVFKTVEHQIVFIAVFIIMFFLLHRVSEISRVFVALFALFNVILCSLGRLSYRKYCIQKSGRIVAEIEALKNSSEVLAAKLKDSSTKHMFCIGSKSIGLYGGYESFILNLLQQH